MAPKIEEERYDRNAPSVKQVCEKLGFILSAGCPDWHIYTDKTRYNSIVVPDDFMAHIVLAFGYEWDFGYQNRDEDLKESIKTLQGNIKIISKESEFNNKMIKDFEITEKETLDIIKKLEDGRKKQTQEYEEKIKNLEYILKTRQRLKEYTDKIIEEHYI